MRSLLGRPIWRRRASSPWNDENLVRAELFSIERLEQHAQTLATAQELTRRHRLASRRTLSARLENNATVLLDAYGTIAADVGQGRSITPAAEWLLDNFHIIEDQIREIRADLPPGYYRQLPKLASGPFAGYPRVFGIAWAFISHTDSLFEPEMLSRFLRAYQRVQPLLIGELWAVAITLRIVLVENLRRAAGLIVSSSTGRQDADAVADRILGSSAQLGQPDLLASRGHDEASASRAFVVQLVQRLRDQDPALTPALRWLEQCLAARKTTSEAIVQDELQRQGAANVTVRNIITSMRLISDVDWEELFESVSLVDSILRASSDFASMDFATRNLYRTTVEELARGSKLTELEIVRQALLASRAAGLRMPESSDRAGERERELDPGYHLIAAGRKALEAAIAYRTPFWTRPRRLAAEIGVHGYVGSTAVGAAILVGAVVLALAAAGVRGWPLGLFALLAVIPSIDATVALLNHIVARSLGARILPGLALRDGIPARLRTLVAIPTLLITREAVEDQIRRLEIHYLASPEEDLHFALLSDWTDAATEHAEGDDALLEAAAAGIDRLNRLHGSTVAGDRFILLHRRRVWCEGQRQWLGWERKRGKIHELNRLLRGATDTTFLAVDGHAPAVPGDVRYVITLDGDTRLPRDTARRLVGKMAHPLNQPRFDAASGRIVEGYAVLQPRVVPSLPVGREGSLFQRVFSSGGGIDPYACAVADVYQDLFGEGSYTGKGIYAIDAFEAALEGRVPDGTLLSHDLFEGTFARAGVASDIEVVEEFPSRYDVAAARQHRWTRGDWQLLPWLLGCAHAVVAQHSRDFPPIGRWKMLDNLRRTLSAPAGVIALLTGWWLPLHVSLGWSSFVVSTIALPTLLPILAFIVPRRAGLATRVHVDSLARDLWLALSQTALLCTFLAHQAWSMADAITRTLFRLFVTHRNLLEWVTAAQAKTCPQLDALGFYRRMAGGVAIGAAGVITGYCLGDARALVAGFFATIWLAAPAIACWVSNSPLVGGHVPVSDEDAQALRRVARRTWRFFETFVTADDHMLPPDNFQENPRPILAHRTSPTNIGLYLLATVSAHDFGWVGLRETIDRLATTLDAMGKLARFRGHLYNWYDTRDLRPLDPRYISAVDSGNLAGHLIAVAHACRGWRDGSDARPRSLEGVGDALALTREALHDLLAAPQPSALTTQQLERVLERMDHVLRENSGLIQGEPLDPSLRRSATELTALARVLTTERSDDAASEVLYWAEATLRSIESGEQDGVRISAEASEAQERSLVALERSAAGLVEAMEFGFLLDPERRLLSIGYLVAEGRLDPSCYDLLASEARLASFVAIAKGDVPARHWVRLGRPVTPIERGAALISWSGSMFEYLMPSLVMRAPAGSLIEQSSRLVVHRQRSYATRLGVPWGISESAYNKRDLELTYQYSNFGVPGLGLKRGLSENLVIAPYATALAAMVDPGAAARNFEHLRSIGARGKYGFYEALDYTPARVPDGQRVAIVGAFMAHHQGMTIVGIANAIFDGRMRGRFHADPSIQATELLLQERTPRDVAVMHPRAEEVRTAARIQSMESAPLRRLRSRRSVVPEAHLLSNGRYAVMITGAGSGYSRWHDLAVTRWREDTSRDDWGSYAFVRDVSGERAWWSAGYQPSGVEPDSYRVTFTEDRAQFVRSDGDITTTLDIVVSPENDAEVRRVSLTNGGTTARILEVTSYAELVLGLPSADAAHASFSKLFVETEYDAEVGALLATRRRRETSEPSVWAAHDIVVEGETLGEVELETDRARFLGRGRDLRAPLALTEGRSLSNTVGTVLDPIFALRRRVRVEPGATARIAFWTVVAASRTEVLDLIDKHHDTKAFERAATLAWTQAQVQLRHTSIEASEASSFQRLASHVLYSDPSLRPPSDALRRGSGGPDALWAHGISGDFPIVLVRIDTTEDLPLVRQLLRAHEYWRSKQLAVDLVILNERDSSYIQDLQLALEATLRTRQALCSSEGKTARGAVFALRSDLLSEQTRARLPVAARVVLAGSRGSLRQQLDRTRGPIPVARSRPERAPRLVVPGTVPKVTEEPLELFNGIGGFGANGREYVTRLHAGQTTPAPWLNVVANPSFGFQVSSEGCGYTWSLSGRENQLTPWSNDAVSDRPGEALYLRDEASGALWAPTAAPIRDPAGLYVARHGQGYSRFEHTAHGIALELTQFVPLDAPIKISRLKLRNLSGRTRRLSLTAYVEWVLGKSRGDSAHFIVTEIDPTTRAVFARNPWNAAFASRVAFVDLGGQQSACTGDRREFLGQHGSLDRPAALADEAPLSGRVGAGLDPCAALQTRFELRPGGTLDIPIFLGQTASAAEAQKLIARYRTVNLDAELSAVVEHWDELLETVQVSTPDRSLDLLVNRWLLYQTLVCRMWARSALYQASGAYGFRDQLQDGMALAVARPGLTRAHLLRAAARQFLEGDVQHWWLPHSEQGVRTRISDDRIWLAYAAAHYVETTGDSGVLDEIVPFLEGRALGSDEHERYFQASISDETASLFEHCARGLDQSLAVGERGLPLMGTGDWNDGMNRVGAEGKGESIWLGWFLHTTLCAFAALARLRGESERDARWRSHAAALQLSLEVHGWDGEWYRRGYFDDGTPLGSAASEECRIDSIAQSWSAISGAAKPDRAARAMAAVEEHLIQRASGLALLFTPPFDRTPLDPGYVKSYPPGIRENGGQYTHAAAWAVIAFAALGQGDKAANLFALVNPLHHTSTPPGLERYRVEPYVVAADVYSVAPHVGRGGWTWYTGSAGWMYRAGLESILGFRLQGSHLLLTPCIPARWPRFEIRFRYRSTRYEIVVENPRSVGRGATRLDLDGKTLPDALPDGGARIPLVDDGGTHSVRVVLG